MVLDHHCEKSIKRYAEHGKKRLESAVQGCRKINKRLQGSGINSRYMDTGRSRKVSKDASRIYNRKEENDDDDDDDDDMSMVSVCEDVMESSDESMNEEMGTSLSELDIVQMSNKPKKIPKREKPNAKKRKPSFNPYAMSKKRKMEFAVELMDLSDDEESEKTTRNKYTKYAKRAANHHNSSRMENMGSKKRRKGRPRKMEKKPKTKAMLRRKSLKRRKKSKYLSEEEMSPDKSICVKSEKASEKESTKQNMQNDEKGGGNANNYKSDSADKKGNAVGDNRNVNNEKAVADEKKAASAINKGPGHGEITSKVSKENAKNDTSKVNKAKEKVEDLSKKVDQKEVKDVDEEVARTRTNGRVSRFHKPRQPSIKIMGISSGKPSKKVPPFIKFYMSVYRELCDSRSVKTIAKEAAKRWKGMTTEEKNMFYTKT